MTETTETSKLLIQQTSTLTQDVPVIHRAIEAFTREQEGQGGTLWRRSWVDVGAEKRQIPVIKMLDIYFFDIRNILSDATYVTTYYEYPLPRSFGWSWQEMRKAQSDCLHRFMEFLWFLDFLGML